MKKRIKGAGSIFCGTGNFHLMHILNKFLEAFFYILFYITKDNRLMIKVWNIERFILDVLTLFIKNYMINNESIRKFEIKIK